MKRCHLQLILITLLMTSPTSAMAFSWKELWNNADQQGAESLATGQPKQAAAQFRDPNWKGVANYRAGDYQAAASHFLQQDNPENNYNRGNALAQAGQYQQAIEAYDRTLQQNPKHQDAQFNRELVKKLLKQQNSSSQANSGNKGGKNNQQNQSSQQNQPEQNDQNQQQPKQQQSQEQQPSTQEQNTKQQASPQPTAAEGKNDAQVNEQQRADQELLNQIPDDPAGLLRRKFQRDHERMEAEASQ